MPWSTKPTARYTQGERCTVCAAPDFMLFSPQLTCGFCACAPVRASQVDMSDPVTSSFVLRCVLHAVDISNPAKEWSYYLRWSDRILEEFFNQGDKERIRGLPISPGFDREKMSTIKVWLWKGWLVHEP